MTKILQITTFSASVNNFSKQNNNKPKKEFYLNLNQNKLLSLGIASTSLGVIRACYAFDEIKKAANKSPLRGSLLQGAITTGFMAAAFALTQIRYGLQNKPKES